MVSLQLSTCGVRHLLAEASGPFDSVLSTSTPWASSAKRQSAWADKAKHEKQKRLGLGQLRPVSRSVVAFGTSYAPHLHCVGTLPTLPCGGLLDLVKCAYAFSDPNQTPPPHPAGPSWPKWVIWRLSNLQCCWSGIDLSRNNMEQLTPMSWDELGISFGLLHAHVHTQAQEASKN